MSLLILTLSFLFSFLSSNLLMAQTVLIPDQAVTAEDYFSRCNIEGNICAANFQLEQLQGKPTPLFDSLIDSISLTEIQFLKALPKKIQEILENEMISVEQLSMLYRLVQQTESESNRLLLIEIKFLLDQLDSQKKTAELQEDFVVFFKVPIKKENFKKMKRSILNITYSEISFNRLAQQRNTKKNSSTEPQYLVTGNCEKFQLNLETEPLKYKLYFENSCGWTKSFQQSSERMFTVVNNNKSWFIAGALVVGAALIANQYEFTIQY